MLWTFFTHSQEQSIFINLVEHLLEKCLSEFKFQFYCIISSTAFHTVPLVSCLLPHLINLRVTMSVVPTSWHYCLSLLPRATCVPGTWTCIIFDKSPKQVRNDDVWSITFPPPGLWACSLISHYQYWYTDRQIVVQVVCTACLSPPPWAALTELQSAICNTTYRYIIIVHIIMVPVHATCNIQQTVKQI